MRLEFWLRSALEPALSLLPPKMDTPHARAMVMAICLQESRLQFRRQVGGPARSYGQFEQGGGVRGVLQHPASRPHILTVLAELDYATTDPGECFVAIEHNDILAAAFARLLLYTLPNLLPVRSDVDGAYEQYLAAWRPGKAKPDTWPGFYNQAWGIVDA